MSAYIGRFVFNGLAHLKYAIIRGIGVRCDLSEVIETGFGDVHPPPEFKIEKEKRGFSFFFVYTLELLYLGGIPDAAGGASALHCT